MSRVIEKKNQKPLVRDGKSYSVEYFNLDVILSVGQKKAMCKKCITQI